MVFTFSVAAFEQLEPNRLKFSARMRHGSTTPNSPPKILSERRGHSAVKFTVVTYS
jgi:hypothetical protein